VPTVRVTWHIYFILLIYFNEKFKQLKNNNNNFFFKKRGVTDHH